MNVIVLQSLTHSVTNAFLPYVFQSNGYKIVFMLNSIMIVTLSHSFRQQITVRPSCCLFVYIPFHLFIYCFAPMDSLSLFSFLFRFF